jgi:hypothetical protein
MRDLRKAAGRAAQPQLPLLEVRFAKLGAKISEKAHPSYWSVLHIL